MLVTLSEMDIQLLPMLHLWCVTIIPALLQYVRESKSRYHGEREISPALHERAETRDLTPNMDPEDLQAPQMHSATAAPRNRRLDG